MQTFNTEDSPIFPCVDKNKIFFVKHQWDLKFFRAFGKRNSGERAKVFKKITEYNNVWDLIILGKHWPIQKNAEHFPLRWRGELKKQKNVSTERGWKYQGHNGNFLRSIKKSHLHLESERAKENIMKKIWH